VKDAQEDEDMTRRSDRTRLVSEEAACWYIRSNDERSMSISDRREFLAWLKRSPENIAELLRISELDGKLAREKLIATVTALEGSNVIELGMLPGGAQHHYEPGESLNDEYYEKMNNKTASWRMAAIAAAVTIAFLLGFMLLPLRPAGETTVKTGASQWQHMALADGSIIYLDARTELSVDFSEQQRVIHLRAGQAVFEVAKDVNRPFIVSTSIVDAIAVGTRFSVAIDPGVTTTVSEGIVKVTPHGQRDDEAAVTVTAGEELHVSDSGLTTPAFAHVAKVNADRKLAWTNGWFIFEGETIAEAAAAFNRRNAVQIEIDNAAIAERRLGYFRFQVGSPESFAKLLDSEPGIALTIDRSSNVLRLQLE
jgi:transmembrane sensor